MRLYVPLLLVCALHAVFVAALDEDVDGFHLKMTGTAPSYDFWLDTNETDVYTFRLDSVFEINPATKEKYTDSVVKFVAWNVGAVTDEEDGKVFTVSHGMYT